MWNTYHNTYIFQIRYLPLGMADVTYLRAQCKNEFGCCAYGLSWTENADQEMSKFAYNICLTQNLKYNQHYWCPGEEGLYAAAYNAVALNQPCTSVFCMLSAVPNNFSNVMNSYSFGYHV
jgi:hypothetical protein